MFYSLPSDNTTSEMFNMQRNTCGTKNLVQQTAPEELGSHSLNLSLRVSYRDIKAVLTSVLVDEILWCDYSNETSSAILFTWYYLNLSILQNEIWDLS